jgi:hypothetical protein
MQERTIDVHWVPSNTIRLLGDNCKIMLDPGNGFDFDEAIASPPEAPEYPELPKSDKTIKVGMSADTVKPSTYTNRNTGDVMEKPRGNEAVFIRVTTVDPGYEFY